MPIGGGIMPIRSLLFACTLLITHTMSSIRIDTLNIMSFVPLQERIQETRKPEHTSIRPIIEQIRLKSPSATTLLINKKMFSVKNSIPKVSNPHDTIFVYCHGWVGNFFGHKLRSNGLGTQIAHHYIKQGILHGTVVTFDFPNDNPKEFNLAQENDMNCVQLVIQEVLNVNPHARIVLVGDSRGAATILNLITHSSDDTINNIAGVIIECPPISLARVAQDFVWNIPYASGAAHALLQCCLPAYKPGDQIKTVFNGKPFPKEIPILIGRVSCDWHTSAQSIQEIADHIKKGGNRNVYLYTHTPTTRETWTKCWHAQMARVPGYRHAVNEFCRQFDLHAQPCAVQHPRAS